MKHIVVHRISLKALFAFVVIVFASVGAFGHTVGATSSNSRLFVSADNTFFVYARGGEKITANFTRSSEKETTEILPEVVTVVLDGPSLDPQQCTLAKDIKTGDGCGFSDVTAPQTGIYRVQFKLPETAKVYAQVSPNVRWGANMFSWKVTVSDNGIEKTGRIWSEFYAVRQPFAAEDAVDLVYYYMSESGYLYKATYKGYNGQISTLSADAFGIRTGNKCESAYRSIEVNDTKMSPSFGACGGSYKLFFEQPAGDLPQNAKQWDGKQGWVNPSITRPVVSDLKFTGDKSGDVQSGKISFKLKNFVGQYLVKVDTNNDGSFDGTADVRIARTLNKLTDDTQELNFSGINRDGQPVPSSQPIGVKIVIEKLAEIHLVNADVEGRTGGLELIRQSGDNAPTTRMCWDDTDLPPLTNALLMTKVLDGRNCPDSTGGVHGWAYATGSWGDVRYIDDWASANAKVDGTIEIRYPDETEPLITKVSKLNVQVVVAVVGGTIVLLVALVFIIKLVLQRRKHARMLKEAQLHHQPDMYPGPGDPRPPQV
jgi:hypothetical protein